MKPELISKPKFTVVGMKIRSKNEHNEIPQLWQQFGPRMGEVQALVNPEVAYGLMGNYEMATGAFDYMAGQAVKRAAAIPNGMSAWEVPAQTYLVVETTLAQMGETYRQINESWLPQSGHQRSGGTEFELYDESFKPGDPNSMFYIYIPVQ